MPNLFARAASLLLGDSREDASDPDALLLLELLGYAEFSAGKSSAEAHHRARLLMLASRFVRVFELDAPEAPGLVCFGAEIDPAMADPLHAGDPIVIRGLADRPGDRAQLQRRFAPAGELSEIERRRGVRDRDARTSWQARFRRLGLQQCWRGAEQVRRRCGVSWRNRRAPDQRARRSRPTVQWIGERPLAVIVTRAALGGQEQNGPFVARRKEEQ